MKTTQLPELIRECIDGGARPISLDEVKTRAARTTRRASWFAPVAIGAAVAGIAGVLIATQVAFRATGRPGTTLSSATLKQIADSSRAAMTSGRAEIVAVSQGSTLDTEHVTFDGANWTESLDPGVTGLATVRFVNGQAYRYYVPGPSVVPPVTTGWVHLVRPGASLGISDPRGMLSVLPGLTGFVTDGYATVDGRTTKHLRDSMPGSVSLQRLIPTGDRPANPRLSQVDLWVDPADVVVRAAFEMVGIPSVVSLPGGKDHRVRHLRVQASPITVIVTFSQIGQPQQRITAPAHYTTAGSQG